MFGVTLRSCVKLRMATSYPRGNSPFAGEGADSKKLIYPAATRNREPILNVFRTQLPKYFAPDEKLLCVEIASGSGQHLAHFAPEFPNITFQPTDVSSEVLYSITAYAKDCPTKNMKTPIRVDITEDLKLYNFRECSIDIIYCSNMIHVSPYVCTVGLFRNAAKYLNPKGIMITYGPYAIDGVISPQSNIDFDTSLKLQCKEWGIRCLTKLTELAKHYGIYLKQIFELPANNNCVIWGKQ